MNENIVLKISVLQSGQLLKDGTESTLTDLDSHLAAIKSQNGVVWYYREGAQGEPPPISMQVIDLVVKHRLPISMSTRPDFSDVVDEKGASRPRK